MEYAKPTDYRISTITSTGSVGTTIDLDLLFECLECDQDTFLDNGIVYVEYGRKKTETFFKGYSKKYSINRRKTEPSKRFDNQLTIVYNTNIHKNLNVKTFRNGNVQITGIKLLEEGYHVVDIIIELLRKLYHTKNKLVIGNIDDLNSTNYKIRLINTDFRVGFAIKREILYKILSADYDIVCNYEPVIYPGVKMHYFYNKSNEFTDGICRCSKKCHDKKSGTGQGNMNCKKITIAIFQSGCVIITGSQTRMQIDECYAFINQILYKKVDLIEKKTTILEPNKVDKMDKSNKIKYRVLKSSIRY
jgi:TATA-box binding protein (TBP) (component of TFIID and TFIIIB)